MSNQTTIWTLRSGLSSDLKEELHYRDKPTGLALFVAFLKKADINMKAYQAENPHRHRPTPVHKPAPRRSAHIATTTPAHASHTPGRQFPMDVSAGCRQVSQHKNDARLREGRCFCCGGIEHMSSTCGAK